MQHLLRKQIILLVALLSIGLAALSQTDEVYRPYNDERPIYLGLNVGLINGYMNFERGNAFLNPSPGDANWISNYKKFNAFWNMGLSANLRLSNHFLLRVNPNLLIGQKEFQFTTKPNTIDTFRMKTNASIINLPIALKLESDRYNFFKHPDFMRHYVFAGVKFDYDLSAGKTPDIIKISKALTSYPNPVSTANFLSSIDYGYEFGLGLSFYFQYATISPEIKFSYGQKDIQNKNTLLNSLDKVSSNFIYFTIHLEGESFFLKN